MKNLLNKLHSKSKSGEQQPLLAVTQAAKEKIESIIESEEVEVQGLRVSIQGRTASAFEYGLGLENEPESDDLVVDVDAFSVFVDPKSAENLKGATIDYVEDLNSSGFRIDNPNTPTWDNPKAQAIQALIDDRINPSVAAHGGHIDLLDVTDDSIYVHMGGGCQGCGMASVTLKHGIEAMVRESFPEITNIVDTTDHASGTNPYYQPAKG
ncbi:MAG: iron-sulfur cluster assembly accessory protein [Candidatus Poribacteria bacterium]|nr:iron-sulfur cluster assembly accessory protein [Candidatus Poribacteria bacterium]MDE0504404.1 iron-sulfur cluster assembly accessory protein [Candidatus Poribacteria bacterium]